MHCRCSLRLHMSENTTTPCAQGPYACVYLVYVVDVGGCPWIILLQYGNWWYWRKDTSYSKMAGKGPAFFWHSCMLISGACLGTILAHIEYQLIDLHAAAVQSGCSQVQNVSRHWIRWHHLGVTMQYITHKSLRVYIYVGTCTCTVWLLSLML